MGKLKYYLLYPLSMWAVFVLGAYGLWQAVPQGRLFEQDMLGNAAILLGIINWVYVYAATLKNHSHIFAHPKNIKQLVMEGRYAVVRHPLYLADIILGWCVFIFLPEYQMLAVVIWLSLSLVFWANLEERLLEEKFLDDYRAYKKRVPMFIPRFKKKTI